MPTLDLTWHEDPDGGGKVWHACGADGAVYHVYEIDLYSMLPRLPRPPGTRTHFLVRRTSPEMLRAYGLGVGYTLGEEHSLRAAQALAERKHWVYINHRDSHVPEDTEAAALTGFWWPISDGTNRGALAVRYTPEGRAEAEILSMKRGEDDRYEMYTLARLDLSALGLGPVPPPRRRRGWFRRR